MNTDNALLTVSNLVKHFDISGGLLEQLGELAHRAPQDHGQGSQ